MSMVFPKRLKLAILFSHYKKRIIGCMLVILFFVNPAIGIEISFFSDFTSSDVTVYSDQNLEGKVIFELLYAGNVVESHELPLKIKAGETAYKVIIWQKKPQHDYYIAKVSIYNNSQLLGSKTSQVSYGTVALPDFHVVDFSPSNTGVLLLLRAFKPSVVDIRIELLDGDNIVYTETKEDVSIITSSEVRMRWGVLLDNNNNYTVRAKIFTHRLYASPLVHSYIADFKATQDVEILQDDVEVDEYGASVTLQGRSQVPFDGFIIITLRNKETNRAQTYLQQVEEILVSGKEDTSGVVWKALPPGVYDVEIRAIDKENNTLDRYETVLRIPENQAIIQAPVKKTPGFTVFTIIVLLVSRRFAR